MITSRSFKESLTPLSFSDYLAIYENSLILNINKQRIPLITAIHSYFDKTIELKLYCFNIVKFLAEDDSYWKKTALKNISRFLLKTNAHLIDHDFLKSINPRHLSYFNFLTFIINNNTPTKLFLSTNTSYVQYPFCKENNSFNSTFFDLVNTKSLKDYFNNNYYNLFSSENQHLVNQFKKLPYFERFLFLEDLKKYNPYLYYVFIGYIHSYPALIHPFPYFPNSNYSSYLFDQESLISTNFRLITFDLNTFIKLFPDLAATLLNKYLSETLLIYQHTIFNNVNMYIQNANSDFQNPLLLLT